VLNVLETYPRDELFQAGVPDLIRIVRGVVNLYERRTVRLLVRRDPYHRFYSCLVYVPRDRYNTEVRQRIERMRSRASPAPVSRARRRSPARATHACTW
jgi:glutamate dehydrogenase